MELMTQAKYLFRETGCSAGNNVKNGPGLTAPLEFLLTAVSEDICFLYVVISSFLQMLIVYFKTAHVSQNKRTEAHNTLDKRFFFENQGAESSTPKNMRNFRSSYEFLQNTETEDAPQQRETHSSQIIQHSPPADNPHTLSALRYSGGEDFP